MRGLIDSQDLPLGKLAGRIGIGLFVLRGLTRGIGSPRTLARFAAYFGKSPLYLLVAEQDRSRVLREADFAARLRWLRIEKGWNFGEEVMETGLDRGTPSRAERGLRLPSVATAGLLSVALETSVPVLFTGVEREGFGAWLNALRTAIDMPLDEMAGILGLEEHEVRDIESGNSLPHFEALRSFARASKTLIQKYLLAARDPDGDLIKDILDKEPYLRGLSDPDLSMKTAYLQGEWASGTIPREALVSEALAVFREATRRVMLRHGRREEARREQLRAALALIRPHAMVEQPSGEGKSLSIALAAYVSALLDKSSHVHIHTRDDVLAKRDWAKYGAVFSALGLSVGLLQGSGENYFMEAGAGLRPGASSRVKHGKDPYKAAITFGPGNEFIFEFERDELVPLEERWQPAGGPGTIFLDEADEALLDQAPHPLVISTAGGRQESVNFYANLYQISKGLEEGTGYELDARTKSVALTPEGKAKALDNYIRRLTGVSRLYTTHKNAAANRELLITRMQEAIAARRLFRNGYEYVLVGPEDNLVVKILDPFTRRIRERTVWYGNLTDFAAIKEREDSNRPVQLLPRGPIQNMMTPQSFYRLFADRLRVISATLAEDAEELEHTYDLLLTRIPSSSLAEREEEEPRVYLTDANRDAAVLDRLPAETREGDPVLIYAQGIPLAMKLHGRIAGSSLLTALQEPQEHDIISRAGARGVIAAIAGVAGRGTDVRLQADEFGRKPKWLTVFIVEPPLNRRTHRQLRNRAGRANDPGKVIDFSSLDDDLYKYVPKRRDALKRDPGIIQWAEMHHGELPRDAAKSILREAQGASDALWRSMRRQYLDLWDLLGTQRRRFSSAIADIPAREGQRVRNARMNWGRYMEKLMDLQRRAAPPEVYLRVAGTEFAAMWKRVFPDLPLPSINQTAPPSAPETATPAEAPTKGGAPGTKVPLPAAAVALALAVTKAFGYSLPNLSLDILPLFLAVGGITLAGTGILLGVVYGVPALMSGAVSFLRKGGLQAPLKAVRRRIPLLRAA